MQQTRSRMHCGGVIIPLVLVVLVALLAFASLAVDYGRVRLARAELQAAADAAARYAALGISNSTLDAKGIDAANDNTVDSSTLVLTNNDIDLGYWNVTTKTFTEGGSPSNAVRVTASRTESNGNAVPLVFGQIIG